MLSYIKSPRQIFGMVDGRSECFVLIVLLTFEQGPSTLSALPLRGFLAYLKTSFIVTTGGVLLALYQWVEALVEALYQWVEARDATEHKTVPITKNYLAQNVNITHV